MAEYGLKGRIVVASNVFVYTKTLFALQNACWRSAPTPFDLHFPMQATPPCGLIRRLHKSDTFVLAVDLPSGINTDTGEVAEGAAHADLTVTFDSYKPLHMAEASAPLCGKIICADIGIRDEWHPEF